MIEVVGIDEAIEAIARLHSAEKLDEFAAEIAHRLLPIAVDNTPVDTGAMAGSWMVEHVSPLNYLITINPSSINPRSGAPVTTYAPKVNERVGILDTVVQAAPRIVAEETQRYGVVT